MWKAYKSVFSLDKRKKKPLVQQCLAFGVSGLTQSHLAGTWSQKTCLVTPRMREATLLIRLPSGLCPGRCWRLPLFFPCKALFVEREEYMKRILKINYLSMVSSSARVSSCNI